MHAVLERDLTNAQRRFLLSSKQMAKDEWSSARHPNWRIWKGVDLDNLKRSMYTKVKCVAWFWLPCAYCVTR